ncbi:MAG: ATP-binding protein, partial [Tepidisphaeraceae bacterium]
AASEFRTDTRLVYLVLKNLVENSIKFTPGGGRVTVSFQQSPPAASSAGGNVTLTVADTGIGIAPEHIERVFERFYQVDAARSGSAGRGTGLGLAIVKHAVHALGGTVRLQSAVGAGTTVTCEFPQTNVRQTEDDPEPTAA